MFKIDFIVFCISILILIAQCYGEQGPKQSNEWNEMAIDEEAIGEKESNKLDKETDFETDIVTEVVTEVVYEDVFVDNNDDKQTAAKSGQSFVTNNLSSVQKTASKQPQEEFVSEAVPEESEFQEEEEEKKPTVVITEKVKTKDKLHSSMVFKSSNKDVNSKHHKSNGNANYRDTLLVPKRERRVIARYKVIIPVIVPNVRVRVSRKQMSGSDGNAVS